MAAAPEIVELPQRRSPMRAAFVALRPRQWLKNLLVFAGLVFAAKLGDAGRWLEAVAAFAAYCAISSAAYLANDLRDREDDRLHPVKRARPIARGELSPRAAVALAAGLAAVALALAGVLGLVSVAFLLAFAALPVMWAAVPAVTAGQLMSSRDSRWPPGEPMPAAGLSSGPARRPRRGPR